MNVHRIAERIAARKKIVLPLLLAVFLLAGFFLWQEGGKAAGTADSAGGPKVIVLNYHKVDNMNISLSVPPSEF